MKAYLKLGITAIVALVLACLPISTFYFVWSWAVDQVPQANEWAGLMKVGLTLLMIAVGGPITVGLTIMFVALGGSIALVILD